MLGASNLTLYHCTRGVIRAVWAAPGFIIPHNRQPGVRQRGWLISVSQRRNNVSKTQASVPALAFYTYPQSTEDGWLQHLTDIPTQTIKTSKKEERFYHIHASLGRERGIFPSRCARPRSFPSPWKLLSVAGTISHVHARNQSQQEEWFSGLAAHWNQLGAVETMLTLGKSRF